MSCDVKKCGHIPQRKYSVQIFSKVHALPEGLSMYVCMYVFLCMSHRGGLRQYFYSVHALGIIHQQQSWFDTICKCLFKISICCDLQKMVIQSVPNLELNLCDQNNNTLRVSAQSITSSMYTH